MLVCVSVEVCGSGLVAGGGVFEIVWLGGVEGCSCVVGCIAVLGVRVWRGR